MRLDSLILDSYGPFLNQELTFDPAPGRLNLLVAPNGAGKSVLRGAFSDLLFDIGHQSPMTFAYPAARLRLTARVRLEDGGTRVLMRRKGQGNTLSDGAAPMAPEDLRALLGGADQYLFEALFALDSHALRRGGDDLSHSSGRLGHMLLAGGGGLGTERLLEALIRDRDAIGRADHRHIARPLWRAAAEAAEAGRRLAHAALRPDAWQGMEKRAAEAERQLAVLREERVAVEAELAGLTALRAVRPWLARRDGALAVLAAAGDVPRLEPDFETRWHTAVEEHVRFGAAAAERARQAAEAEAALAGQAPDTTLLQAAERIEQVLRDAIRAASATNDLPRIEAGCHDAVVEAARLRRELGWEAAVQVPPAPALRAARVLLTARTGLVADAGSTASELAKARQHLKGAQADLDALPPAEDTAALAALVRDIRAAGDPARRLDTARRARRDAEAALVAALAGLPGQRLTREQLAATKAPAEATLAAREAALTGAEAACRDALRVRDGLARERADAEADLARLTREAALPAPGALAAARAERDRLWDAVCAGGGADAFVAFERALRQADAVADLLIAHAAQVATAEAERRHIDDTADRHAAAERDCAVATTQLRRAREELAVLARAAGAPAQAIPAVLRAFLTARDTALQRGIALDRAGAEEADLVAALNEAARRLADLGAAGDGLAAMLGAAEMRVAESRDATAARKAALMEHRKAGREAQDRTAAEARARQALEVWTAAWREAVAVLARPDGESPEATGAALELVELLRAQETAVASASVRIRDMRAAIDDFAAGIAALCAQVAPDLAALPPQEAAARLRSMLRAQQDAATLRQAELSKRDAALIAAAAAGGKARAAAAELAALRAALGVTDDEAAAAQLERVRRVATAEKELAEARRHIASQGGDQPEAQLDAMAAASSAEEEKLRIGALEARQAQLGPLLEAASAEARSAADERSRAGQGEAAQEAAARREAALATLARHAEEALVLHAAASLLRAGMKSGEDAEGSAAVARIGAVFRRITGGAHAGVAVQDDGTDRVLVALEADGTTAKHVAELSEGTSDQLFLALRIAALEAYVRNNPPLPFIADDVLQTFDDARAAAALRALLDLSAHVQVIVLTHHPHVQALARALPAGTVHTVTLPDPTGAGIAAA
jgi:uncharacterized protein YhaN